MSVSCLQRPQITLDVPPKVFQNDDFEITLDSNWKDDHDDASFGWQDAKLKQEIRIVVMHIHSADTVEHAIQEYFAIRKRTLEEYSGGLPKFSDPVMSTRSNGEVEMRFRVDDDKSRVRMCTIVRSNSHRLVSFTFFKYFPLLSVDEIDKRCDELVTTLIVH